MEISEHRLAVAQHRPFVRQRLLYLDDEIGLRPDGRGVADDLGASQCILIVLNAAAQPNPGWDEHSMPYPAQFFNSYGDHCHPVFVRFNLSRHADDHFAPDIRVGGALSGRPAVLSSPTIAAQPDFALSSELSPCMSRHISAV